MNAYEYSDGELILLILGCVILLFAVIIGLPMIIAYLWPTRRVPTDKIGVVKIGGNHLTTVVERGKHGVQPEFIQPGRSYNWWKHRVRTFPLVVVPKGCVGVVTSHIGANPVANSSPYNTAFGDFTSVEAFLTAGGCKGAQQAGLPPGTYAIHPFAFEVLVVGGSGDKLVPFGLQSDVYDLLAEAEPFTVPSKDGVVVSTGTVGTTAAQQMLERDMTGTLVTTSFVTRPDAKVSIEWEVGYDPARPEALDKVKEDLRHLADFSVWSQVGLSVPEFVRMLHSLADFKPEGATVWVVEANMVPTLTTDRKLA